jgi:uncharacterized membrane protein YadS
MVVNSNLKSEPNLVIATCLHVNLIKSTQKKGSSSRTHLNAKMPNYLFFFLVEQAIMSVCHIGLFGHMFIISPSMLIWIYA